MESLNLTRDGTRESSVITPEEQSYLGHRERENIQAESHREKEQSAAKIDLEDNPVPSTMQQLQRVPNSRRASSRISSSGDQLYQKGGRDISDEEKKSFSPNISSQTRELGKDSSQKFPFTDEVDEYQNPIFYLEASGRDEIDASLEETKEGLQNDIQNPSSCITQDDGLSTFAPDRISSSTSPLYLPPTAKASTCQDIDDETLNSSVSSRHVGSAVSIPPGSTSLSESNSGSLQPFLYSAIGSLEICSANSFGKVRIQHKATSSRDFDRPIISQKLIPPAKPAARPERDGSVYSKEDPSNCMNENITKKGALKATAESNHGERSSNGKIVSNGTLKTTRQALDGDETDSKPERRKPKKVTIKESKCQPKPKKPVEMFRPSCDAYTPRMEKKKIKYMPAEMRTPVQTMSTTMGTLARPNFRDALRRVAMILQQHITKIERRFEVSGGHFSGDGLFQTSMREAFSEEKYSTPRFRCTMVRIPMARPGMVYGMRKIRPIYTIPTEQEIYDFGHQLFKSVQLSSECSIVCLIYVERLMEVAKVPLLASTWRPIFMCGLLLASKVWQDLSSWNIEFASVYPQFSLEAINKLELEFLRMVKWDLYISSSLYAKYYFALRSLLEKQDFRMRYNRMVGGVGSVDVSEALKVQQRSERVKEEVLLQLSRSM